ncbi:YqhA family protein [Deinococcus altitudinis]|uniref:YqhA family protein n=1 Tax=Deinococcus altitudinis TaxID=468914 RepID=UPI003892C53E
MKAPPDSSSEPAPVSPISRVPQGLQRRGFGLTLLIVEFGVLSSLLFSLTLYIFGTVQTVRELWHALPRIGQPDVTRELLISAIEQTDVLLVATALLIISIGLQALFVQRLENLPAWLHIRTFDDLKNKLLGIVVVALVVEFFKAALKWDGTSDILTLALALAAVILAATAYSYVLTRFSSEHAAPEEE